jgi:cephalosporin hydroxylase
MKFFTRKKGQTPGKRDKEETVIRYYDRNTKRFLSLGQGGPVFAIHRAVWAPGVSTREEGMHYVHDLIASVIEQAEPDLVADLGCGIGGSMLYLARKCAARFYGVTVSSVQAAEGGRLIKEKEMEARITIDARSYLDASLYKTLEKKRGKGASLFYGIESFLHSPSVEQLVEHLSGFCKAGDVLIVCDDFLSEDGGGGTAQDQDCAGRKNVPRKAARMVSRFRENWKTHGLISSKRFIALACSYGFRLEEDRDLTAFLELGRGRDKIIRLVVFFLVLLPFRISWMENMIGGDALQYLLERRFLEYRYIMFKKAPPRTRKHSC